jgi:hypothetical protein
MSLLEVAEPVWAQRDAGDEQPNLWTLRLQFVHWDNASTYLGRLVKVDDLDFINHRHPKFKEDLSLWIEAWDDGKLEAPPTPGCCTMARILISDVGRQMNRYGGDLRSQLPPHIADVARYYMRCHDPQAWTCPLCLAGSAVTECPMCRRVCHRHCQASALPSEEDLYQDLEDLLEG